MNCRLPLLTLSVLSLAAWLAAFPAVAEEPADETPMKVNFEKFEKLLSGAKLTGQYTIIGKEKPPQEETYEITSVKKMPQGDYWMFNTRVKYGGKDFPVVLPMQVKWAGDTPMIYLDNFTIPGVGTFNARVLFNEGKYAGTWTHGKVGGHMFGVLKSGESSSAGAED